MSAVALVLYVVELTVLFGVRSWLQRRRTGSTGWRIGVDRRERTDLVTTGVFAHVRNPIVTAMVVAQLGIVLLVPTWISAPRWPR